MYQKVQYWILFGFCAFVLSTGKESEVCEEISTFFSDMCQYEVVKSTCSQFCKTNNDSNSKLTCGKRTTYPGKQNSRHRMRRIVGGIESEKGEWPWHVSLQLGGKHICGASILSPHYLITAAHCLHEKYFPQDEIVKKKLSVVAGTNEHKIANVRKIPVELFVYHRFFKLFIHRWKDLYFVITLNDIALIRLEEGIDLGTGNRESICLPDFTIPDYYTCSIVGYGMTEFRGKVSDRLRHAEINTVPIEVCNKPRSFNNNVNKTVTICAGDGTPRISPCKADSGGGLVCQKNGIWYLAGIVASGYKCGGEDAYSMYTRVRTYKEWIAKTIFEFDSTVRMNHNTYLKFSTKLLWVCVALVYFGNRSS